LLRSKEALIGSLTARILQKQEIWVALAHLGWNLEIARWA